MLAIWIVITSYSIHYTKLYELIKVSIATHFTAQTSSVQSVAAFQGEYDEYQDDRRGNDGQQRTFLPGGGALQQLYRA